MYTDSYTVDYSNRNFTYEINSLLANRWSPRSFKKIALEKKTIETLGEAARWSPSHYNSQPWRIIITENESDDFNTIKSILANFNQIWVANASLLGLFIAKLHDDDGEVIEPTNSFDTGFAWAALTFQARTMGLYTHGMSGLDYEKAYTVLNIDKSKYKVLAAFAVGVLDDKDKLPEKLQEKEIPHGQRKALNEILFQGISNNLG